MKYIKIHSIKNSKNMERVTRGFFILTLEFENENLMSKKRYKKKNKKNASGNIDLISMNNSKKIINLLRFLPVLRILP